MKKHCENEADIYLRGVQDTIMEVTDEIRTWQKVSKPYFSPLFPSVVRYHAHKYLELCDVWVEIEDNIEEESK
tara:strand:+ start:758 stop:976 length:219 start_codon:yes stop_codon:yes gene_type:complete